MIQGWPLRLPPRRLASLALVGLLLGLAFGEAGAYGGKRDKQGEGVLVEGAHGLPDLARGQQAAAAGRLEDAERDLQPLAERGYVDAQIALAKLYAQIGTPDRVQRAIAWLRKAREADPLGTEVPLGRLLLRQDDEASLDEGEALLVRGWDQRRDPLALAGLIRLYSEHPLRDEQRRAGTLVAQAERIATPDVQGAVIAWYRASRGDAGHAEKLVALCRRWLDGVPECYVDLAREARAHDDASQLKKLSAEAQQKYSQSLVEAQTLASLARVLVEPLDDADAAAPAPALPLRISDVPEDEGEATLATLNASEAVRTCTSEPVTTASADAETASADPSSGGPAAQPDLANGLLATLMKGPADAAVLAAGVVVRYPYLLPGADIETPLKQGAGQGIPEAKLYLGQLYLAGARAPRDPQQAMQYLQQASEQAATALQSHYFLGRLYQYGYLDESRPLYAAQHLMWAARRGYAAADSALARLFANGKGLCPNLVNAYVFARLGAQEGSASTAALAQQIAAQLAPEQRAQAEALLQAEQQARPSNYEIPKTLLAGEIAAAPAEAARSADSPRTGDKS